LKKENETFEAENVWGNEQRNDIQGNENKIPFSIEKEVEKTVGNFFYHNSIKNIFKWQNYQILTVDYNKINFGYSPKFDLQCFDVLLLKFNRKKRRN
jgi:hypothetical protein